MMRWVYNLSGPRIIALGFLLVIMMGSLLLALPIASRSGEWTPVLDTLFTSASATCVTGLVIYDTYTHWSIFGQIVILAMFQVGGIGLMTVISMFAVFTKRKIGIRERQILMQSAGNMRLSGIVKLIRRVMLCTVIAETAGTILLAIRFIPMMGVGQGLYFSLFHAVSAFCNAGIDLMGKYQPYGSFTGYETDLLINLTIMTLIILGSIGFLVWEDVVKHHFHFIHYALHSKIVLLATVALVIGGTFGYLLFESGETLNGMSLPEQILASAFMSVATRTAGFNMVDMSHLSDSGYILSTIFMFIGGSPGSTAGGVKTTTVAVVILAVWNMARGSENVTVFKKRLEEPVVKQAMVIIFVYISSILLATMVICFLEPISLKRVFFEIVAAASTAGVSQGVTQELSSVTRFVVIGLMYAGKIGGLSLLLVFAERRKKLPLKRPSEKILIG